MGLHRRKAEGRKELSGGGAQAGVCAELCGKQESGPDWFPATLLSVVGDADRWKAWGSSGLEDESGSTVAPFYQQCCSLLYVTLVSCEAIAFGLCLALNDSIVQVAPAFTWNTNRKTA